MKRILLTLVASLALVTSASGQTLNLPNSGAFVDNTTVGFSFDFTEPVQSIKSISMDLTHTWAGDVEIRLIAPGGAGTFSLADNSGGSGNLGGRYTFVESSGAAPWSGLTGNSVYPGGTYNAFTWQTGPFAANGWAFEFQDNAGGDVGTWGGISIDYNAVPEPSALLLIGVAAMAGIRRRRR